MSICTNTDLFHTACSVFSWLYFYHWLTLIELFDSQLESTCDFSICSVRERYHFCYYRNFIFSCGKLRADFPCKYVLRNIFMQTFSHLLYYINLLTRLYDKLPLIDFPWWINESINESQLVHWCQTWSN